MRSFHLITIKMANKIYKPIIVAALCLPLSGCPDPGCLDPDPKYTFDITAAFTPEPDSIHVGDTIFLVSKFPTTLVPSGSKEAVDYSAAPNIGSVLTPLEYMPTQRVPVGAVKEFDFISLKGEAFNSKEVPSPEMSVQVRYEEIGTNYEMRIAIVPRKKGRYSLGISGAYSDSRKVNGKEKCDRASFHITVTNQNHNKDMLEDWIGAELPNKPPNGYAFVVY
jgi:hypothetical protein